MLRFCFWLLLFCLCCFAALVYFWAPLIAAPARPTAWVTTVRVTAYGHWGTTYSGEPTIPGRTAACSWNIPLWSVVTFADGQRYVCTDRGALGSSGWVDLFAPGDWRWVPATYGDYATVTIGEDGDD